MFTYFTVHAYNENGDTVACVTYETRQKAEQFISEHCEGVSEVFIREFTIGKN